MKLFYIIVFGLLGLVFYPASAVAWPDTVDGDRRLSGKITAISPDGLTIKTSSGDKQVATEEIRRISFENEPPGLRNARLNAISGRLNRVVEELDEIDSMPENPMMRAEILFYRAYAVGEMALSGEQGSPSEAAGTVAAFVRDPSATQSIHYYKGIELFGDLASATGHADVAEKYYAKMLQAKSSTFLLAGQIKIADARLAQKKYEDALASYDKAITIKADTPEAKKAKLLAGVGRAGCMAELNRADEAIEYLQKLIATEDSKTNSDLFGRAYNALGRCYQKQGKDKDALYAFLHTDVLFFKNPANHAEALYYLSQLWKTRNQEDRAREALQELKKSYGDSSWAAQAG